MKDKIKEAAREKVEAKLWVANIEKNTPDLYWNCLLYTSPSPRDS